MVRKVQVADPLSSHKLQHIWMWPKNSVLVESTLLEHSSQKVRCHLSAGGCMPQIHGVHCSIHTHLCKQQDLCTSSLSDQTICVHCSFMTLLFSYTQTHTQRYKHTHTLIHIFRYRHAHTYTHAHIQTLMHDLTPAHTVLMCTQNQTKMKWLTQLQKFLNNLATYPKHHGKWT